MIKRFFWFFVFVLTLNFSFSITQFPISSCGVNLDQPYSNGDGIEYVVTGNLTGAGINDCITVLDNDIRLDCQNNVLTGDGYYAGISFYGNNSVAENCEINNFYNGVFFWGSNGNIIRNITSEGNLKGAGVGFDEGSRNNDVYDLTARNNNFGIMIYDSDNNFFKDNILTNNLYGVYLATDSNAAENNLFDGGDYRFNTVSDVQFVKLKRNFGSQTKFSGVRFYTTDTIIGEDPNLDKSYNYGGVKFEGNTYYDDVSELPFCFPDGLNYVCDDTAILPNYEGPDLDENPPTQVQNVIAALVETNSISIVWDAAFDDVGIFGYRVFRNGASIGITPNTYYQSFNLIPNTNYNFEVEAIDTSNNVGPKSFILSVSTLDLPQNETNNTTEEPPEEPTIPEEPSEESGGESSSSSGGGGGGGGFSPYVDGSILSSFESFNENGGEVCVSNFFYENWTQCKNERQTRIVKDLNTCVRLSFESRKCLDGNSDEENLLLNSRELELIEIGESKYLIELQAGYNEIFYSVEDFEYSVFIATDKNTNVNYYGERYDYYEDDKFYFTLKRIDESNIDEVLDIAGIKKVIKIGNYLTRFLVVVMFVTLGVYLYYALVYKPRKRKKAAKKKKN